MTLPEPAASCSNTLYYTKPQEEGGLVRWSRSLFLTMLIYLGVALWKSEEWCKSSWQSAHHSVWSICFNSQLP